MRRLIMLALVAGALGLPATAQAADEGIETAEPAAVSSSSGCRTVDVYRYSKDIFGLLVYKFHQVKTWCWNYPRITSVRVSTYISNVDPNMEYGGIIATNGGYYVWCCNNGLSGHYSFRQGKFKNCILWFPCSRTEYPWVKIWAHANGTFGWATGM